MRRDLLNLAIFTFVIGIFAIYLGMEISTAEQVFSDEGGDYESIMEVMGSFWSILGMVLAFLGLLCFPLGAGVAALKDWGRKNGIVILFLISGLATIAGLITAYRNLMDAIIYFALLVLALICMQLLREKRALFELGTGSRGDYEGATDYKEVDAPASKAVRYRMPASPHEKTRTVKCSRCGSVNVGDKTHCMMCGKEL
jgi:uncharacterized membrane protein YhaH (DUF805 family)